MSPNYITIPTIALALTCFTPIAAQAAVLFSDNFSGDSLSSYTINGSVGQVTYSATAGVGGGGGLAITNTVNHSTSIIPGAVGSNTSFFFNTGATNKVTMSMMLKFSGTLSSFSQAYLGYSNGQDFNWNANTIGNTSAVGGAVASGISLFTRGGTDGAVSNGGTSSPVVNATLTGGNWYLYQVDLTKPEGGTNVWTLTGSLQDFGAAGTAPGSVVLSYSGATNAFGTTAGAGINLANTASFLNFGVRNQMWTAADNFSVTGVPEPSTLAIAMVGLLGLAGRRRRNQSNVSKRSGCQGAAGPTLPRPSSPVVSTLSTRSGKTAMVLFFRAR